MYGLTPPAIRYLENLRRACVKTRDFEAAAKIAADLARMQFLVEKYKVCLDVRDHRCGAIHKRRVYEQEAPRPQSGVHDQLCTARWE